MSCEDEVQLNHRALTEKGMDELLAEIDQLSAPTEEPAPSGVARANPFPPALRALIAAKAAELKADAYANGWTAQAWRAVDAWRAVNADDYNQKRKAEYAIAKLAKTGKLPRSYNKHPTADERAEQVNGAQRRRRAAMTPEERAAESQKRNDRRKRAKQQEREASGLPPRMEDDPNYARF